MTTKTQEEQDEKDFKEFLDLLIRISEDEMPEELKIAMKHLDWARAHIEEDPKGAKECVVAAVAAMVCYSARLHQEKVRALQNQAYGKFLKAVKEAHKD